MNHLFRLTGTDTNFMKEGIQKSRRDFLDNNTKLLPDVIRVKPSTLKEICIIYDMSYKTLRSCLAPITKKIGPKQGKFLTVRQVEIIMNHIGLPYTVKEI